MDPKDGVSVGPHQKQTGGGTGVGAECIRPGKMGRKVLEGWAQAMSRWRALGDLQRSKDPWLIQNEPEKLGARAGRAGELLVCGLQTVTLRTRVIWSLASGKCDCELEEGDNACQSSEDCTSARA